MTIFGNHDDKTLEQFSRVQDRAVRAALLPDGHLGYVMPIGGVAAYDNEVSVVGVGYDIGCGNLAVKTSLSKEDLLANREELADALYAALSFGIGGVAELAASDHYLGWLNNHHRAWRGLDTVGAPVQALGAKAEAQFGSIGAGNHYVDLFYDGQDAVWVGVHFGSRGLGHTIASGFMALAQGRPWGERVPEQETILSLDNILGRTYFDAMELAGGYAHAAREAVVDRVLQVIGAERLDSVHNHHNYAWHEEHFGRELIVVRKGSTPAFPGQRGFVGGSMGDASVILRGARPDELGGGESEYRQKSALYSTVHGAGRTMSRTAAKGKWKKGVMVKPGAVSHAGMRSWLNAADVTLRGGDLDEAPQAYRRLEDVLASAPGVVIESVLNPVIVLMAEGNTVDPYKD